MENPEVISVVYSGDTEVTPETILDNVQVYPYKLGLTVASFQHLPRSPNNSYRPSL
jgi:hypothetical protein